MRLHVDLETLQLIEAPGFRNPVTSLRFKRGDAARLEVVFLENGTTPASIGDPETLELQFGIKPRGRYDVGYLVHEADWTLPEPEAESPVYQCSPSFNTVELDSALGVGSSTGSELSELTLMGEITWREGAGEPTSTRTFLVVVENDVNRGTEGVPESAEPAYPAPQNIALLTSVVRHDTAQTLTTPQQSQARANIGAASSAQGAKADTALQAGVLGLGVNSVMVDASADSALANGTALLAAYTAAKLLTPSGAALSATNRAVVFVAPGRYDLGTTPLVLDTPYIDLIGLSRNRDDAVITAAISTNDSGTLMQTASDVHIANLTLLCTVGNAASFSSPQKPAAYMPWSNLSLTVMTNVKCQGFNNAISMRSGVEYSGTFTDCESNTIGFGYGGMASGTFTNCLTGAGFGYQAAAPGRFVHCRATGTGFGFGSVSSGTYIDCEGGGGSWCSSIGGKLLNCRVTTTTFAPRGTGGLIMSSYETENGVVKLVDDTLGAWINAYMV